MPFGFRRVEPATRDDAWRPAGTGLASGLLTKGGALSDVIASAEAALGTNLPPSLSAFIERADGAEGWVAGEYLAMWPVGQIADLNVRARISDFAPTLVAFATNGGGEGYFFDRATGAFINSPMIGLGDVEPTLTGASFDAMLTWIAEANPSPPEPYVPDPTRFGLVVHEITPIIFGGDPVDPKNKAFVPLADYVEVVAWWNDQVRYARSPSLGQPGS